MRRTTDFCDSCDCHSENCNVMYCETCEKDKDLGFDLIQVCDCCAYKHVAHVLEAIPDRTYSLPPGVEEIVRPCPHLTFFVFDKPRGDDLGFAMEVGGTILRIRSVSELEVCCGACENLD